MADPNEPQEDAVRLNSPVPTAGKPSDMKMRETVRIQVPLRDDRDSVSPQFFRPSNPSVVPLTPVSDSTPLAPKKETMRISAVAATSPVGTEIRDARPFVSTPDLASRNPLVAVEPAKKNPMLLWCVLLGVSALILIIQIWTYLS